VASYVYPDEALGAAEAQAVAALEAENAELRDRLRRALAEAENTRRRADRSIAEGRQYAVTDFARELLPVADNLQRALAAEGQDPALVEGVRATERLLGAALARFDVSKIAAQDAPFDPALHEAVMQVDDDTRPPGTVVQVLEDGYTIRDRLLRPARVVVNRRRNP
jgi:molecular chaperone GrpE